MMTNGACYPGDNKDEVSPTQSPPSRPGSCIIGVIANGLLLYTRKLSAVLGIWLILVQGQGSAPFIGMGSDHGMSCGKRKGL